MRLSSTPYSPDASPEPESGRTSLGFAQTMKATFRVYAARFLTMTGLGLIAASLMGFALYEYMALIFRQSHSVIMSMFSGPMDPHITSVPSRIQVSVSTGLLVLIWCLVGWWANLGFCALADGEVQGHRVGIGKAMKVGVTRLPSLIPVGVGLACLHGGIFWAIQWCGETFTTQFMQYLNSLSDHGFDPNENSPLVWGFTVFIVISSISIETLVFSYLCTVRGFVVIPVMVSERRGIGSALPRSFGLTRRSGGTIYLIVLVGGVVAYVVDIVATQIAAHIFGSLWDPQSLFVNPFNVENLISWALAGVLNMVAIRIAIMGVIAVFLLPILPIASQVIYRERSRLSPGSGPESTGSEGTTPVGTILEGMSPVDRTLEGTILEGMSPEGMTSEGTNREESGSA